MDLDAFAERAAIAEIDGGLDRAAAEAMAAQQQGYASAADLHAATVAGWADQLARLETVERSSSGIACIASAQMFVRNGWAARALALGWSEIELVGADPRAAWERLDKMGAAYRGGPRNPDMELRLIRE